VTSPAVRTVVLCLLFGRPTGQGPYAGQKFGEGEGLGEVVVGAGVEPLHAVLDLGAGGQHEYGHAYIGRPQPLDDLDPVEVREHPVDHQQVEGLDKGAARALRPSPTTSTA
jgi:hypothetical protein